MPTLSAASTIFAALVQAADAFQSRDDADVCRARTAAFTSRSLRRNPSTLQHGPLAASALQRPPLRRSNWREPTVCFARPRAAGRGYLNRDAGIGFTVRIGSVLRIRNRELLEIA